MNRIKWIQWIAVVFIAALVMTGCGNKQSPEIDPPQTGNEWYDEIIETVGQIDSEQERVMNVSVFLKDPSGYVVPITMEVPWSEGPAKLALNYMIEGGMYADQLPEGFTALIPEGTEVIGMDIIPEEKLAIVDLSRHFRNYKAEDERKLLEAITWTLTEFPSIEQVKLWVDGTLLKQMPVTGIPLDEPLSRAMGINLEPGEGVYLGQSTPVTLYFQNVTDDMQSYFVPVTRLIAQTDQVAAAAIEQLAKGPQNMTGLVSTVPSHINVLDIQQVDDVLSVFLSDAIFDANNRVPDQSLQAMILSLTENTGASKVKVMVDHHVEVLGTDDVNYSQPVFRPIYLNQMM